VRICDNTSEDWGHRFLADLKSLQKKQEEHWMAVGFGLASFRMVGLGQDFKALDTQQATCRLAPPPPPPPPPRPAPPRPAPPRPAPPRPAPPRPTMPRAVMCAA
jgi:hypothetical protein